MEFKSTPLCCDVQFDQSQRLARKVLKADSTNARAHAIFAETLAATHDLPRAISEFQKAVELGPHSVEYYMPLEPSTSLPRGPGGSGVVDHNTSCDVSTLLPGD
jgi:hypothetical protein